MPSPAPAPTIHISRILACLDHLHLASKHPNDNSISSSNPCWIEAPHLHDNLNSATSLPCLCISYLIPCLNSCNKLPQKCFLPLLVFNFYSTISARKPQRSRYSCIVKNSSPQGAPVQAAAELKITASRSRTCLSWPCVHCVGDINIDKHCALSQVQAWLSFGIVCLSGALPILWGWLLRKLTVNLRACLM